MKQSLLATAIKTSSVLAIAALSAHAFAAPDIYGQIRMSLLYQNEKASKNNLVDIKKTDRSQLTTGNSRVGIKGSEKLTDNTDLEYKLEYKVDVAENTSSNFSARHGYLALNNKQYGKLLVGRTISQDDTISVGSAYLWGTGIGPNLGHDAAWVNNTIVYTTPKLNNGKTSAFIQYGMDEGEKGGRSFTTFTKNKLTGKLEAKDVSRDFFLVGGTHKLGKTTLSASYTYAGSALNSLRGTVSHKLNDKITLDGLVQYTDFNSNDNELGLFAGVAYKVKEPMTAWVEAYHTDNFKGYSNGKASGLNVGTSYDFSKSLTAYANVGYAKEKYSTNNTDGKGFEIGALYKF